MKKKQRRNAKDFSVSVLQKRLIAVGCALAILFCFLMGRFFYVQVVWQGELNYRALDQ